MEEWVQKQRATKQHATVIKIPHVIGKKPVIHVIKPHWSSNMGCIGKIPFCDLNKVALKSAPKWGSMARSSTCTDAGLGAENDLNIFNEI